MSREVNEDFAALLDFFNGYTLAAAASGEDFKRLLSSLHKKYFAFITVLSELKHQEARSTQVFASVDEGTKQIIVDYMTESASDLGSALFVSSHGAYKAARQVLRSSIKNFFKSIGCFENLNIIRTKNTYEVVDIVEGLAFFSSKENARLFNILKSTYSTLCADVHTSTSQNMEDISALGYFPNFDKDAAASFEKLFRKVTQAYVCVICLMFRSIYHGMHHTNKDVVSNALTPQVRKQLNS
jgi:hypothetical protein